MAILCCCILALIYFSFFVEKGKYYIDFKNGSGQVGEGDPASKADVTITMNEEIFLKIFNRKLTFMIRSKQVNSKSFFHCILSKLKDGFKKVELPSKQLRSTFSFWLTLTVLHHS